MNTSHPRGIFRAPSFQSLNRLVLAAIFGGAFALSGAGLGTAAQAAPGQTVRASATAVAGIRSDQVTALDRYVAAPDTNYSFRLVTSAKTPAGTVHILEMTSQSWLTTNEVNRTLWKHWLTIICPNQISSSTYGSDWREGRIHNALYLISNSPEYQIQK